jgi:quinol monooxygenase YgiN
MIMVQSTFQLVAESKSEALELMKDMVRLCRQEHGCLSYEYFEGVTDTNQVVLLQEWENADCLQGHYQTAHMEEFLGKLGSYLQSEVVTRSYASQDEPRVSSSSSENLAKPEQTIH